MGNWVIAGQPNAVPVVGQTYDVRHSRKGAFKLLVTRVDGEWLTGQIVDGFAKAVMSYNVREEGEEITMRDSQVYLIPVPP